MAVSSSSQRNRTIYDMLAARLASLRFERIPLEIKNRLKVLKRDYQTASVHQYVETYR